MNTYMNTYIYILKFCAENWTWAGIIGYRGNCFLELQHFRAHHEVNKRRKENMENILFFYDS